MSYGEKGISVLATTLIIMIMFVEQTPNSDMNNNFMKVVHLCIWKKKLVLND